MALGLIVGVICGIICALVADSKGRSAVGWFFLGFFFGIFALIAVLIVSNRKEVEEKFAHSEMEQHRLREQLRQEQLKNEQFRKYTQVRLDVHDRELDIDTRHVGPLFDQNNVQPALPDTQQSAEEILRAGTGPRAQGWYYQQQRNAIGPVSFDEVRNLIQRGTIDTATRLWHKSLADWTPAVEVADLGLELDSG